MKNWFFKEQFNMVEVLVLLLIIELVGAVLDHINLIWR